MESNSLLIWKKFRDGMIFGVLSLEGILIPVAWKSFTEFKIWLYQFLFSVVVGALGGGMLALKKYYKIKTSK